MQPWQYKPAKDLGLPHRERMRSLKRESGLFSSSLQYVWWTAIRTYLATYHRLSIRGREHLPIHPPFVLVANHCSHLDVLSLAAALPSRVRRFALPIAAGDTFFETPVRSTFSAMMLNALPMWRGNCGRHAMEDLRSRLVEGDCVYMLFPEGTRSRSGQMADFKAGLGMIIAATSVPVVPCFLSGTFEALAPHRRVPRMRRISLTIGPPMFFSDTPNNRSGWNKATNDVRLAVSDLSDQSKGP